MSGSNLFFFEKGLLSLFKRFTSKTVHLTKIKLQKQNKQQQR